jgi:hypothetical protein
VGAVRVGDSKNKFKAEELQAIEDESSLKREIG